MKKTEELTTTFISRWKPETMGAVLFDKELRYLLAVAEQEVAEDFQEICANEYQRGRDEILRECEIGEHRTKGTE